ncbi:hypothetical protein NDN08_007916 [Rhodosorus marinus]|uniref:SRP54-type proteins GTP-binding domain-containing protein n=1 Tax=Rhodosorus marinus TaxID=101924 RepID=A0AAV8V3I1_9RHOD|nr:hypothetical protein NDN08_007916 [Rhodosorus marinus]
MEDKFAFICGGIASQTRRKLRDGDCFGLPQNRGRVRPRTATVVAVFDFLKQGQKAVEDSGQSIVDYVRKRAQEDIAKVNAFNDGLQKSRERLARELSATLESITTDAELEEALENLEEVLITSDLGMDTVDIVMEDLRAEATQQRLRSEEDVKATLKGTLVRVLKEKGGSAPLCVGSEAPTVVVFVGANGMGKTTTVGKLATRYRKEGKKAAAVEQLSTWADRAEVDIVKPLEGGKNPSSTAFRAVQKGQEEGYDVVIIDTSGRLHTNHNLMGELRKLVSVVKKFKEGGADETLLVVDASIGRNAMSQAVNFQEEIGLTGLAVTKLDGTARAGFVVSVVNDLELPIKLVGVGEKVEDLRDFEPEFFVEGLVG